MSDTTPIYPAVPLEAVVTTNEQQKLLPPTVPPAAPSVPPSYDQATAADTTGPTTTAPPQTATPAHVVVINSPLAVFGPHPMDIECPYCHNFTRTVVRHTPTTRTHMIALILCLLQLWCFIWVPYCIASCMSTSHYCGMCNRYLGSYKSG